MNMRKKFRDTFIIMICGMLLSFFMLVSCTTINIKQEPKTDIASAEKQKNTNEKNAESESDKKTSLDSLSEKQKKQFDEFQKRVIRGAEALINKAPKEKVTVRDKEFTLDCVGTVSAAYYRAGVDLWQDFHKYSGNGVTRLYRSLEDRNALHKDIYPRPGDIVFWDNTWDRNDDGKFGNDPFTHVGLVMKLEDDGTIHFLHEHFTRGVIVQVMNVKKPDVFRDKNGKLLNVPLYMASYYGNPDNPPQYLAGDLWKSFGGVLRIYDSYVK